MTEPTISPEDYEVVYTPIANIVRAKSEAEGWSIEVSSIEPIDILIKKAIKVRDKVIIRKKKQQKPRGASYV